MPAAAQWDPFAAQKPGLAASFSFSGDGLHTRRQSLSAGAALISTGTFRLRASGSAAELQTSDGGYFPRRLYKDALALNAETDGLRAGITLNSDSDKPFYSPAETNLGLTVTKELPDGDAHGVWLLGLNYSTRRSFWRSVPMPFLAYRYVSDKLTVMAPFMASWRPVKTLTFSASWQPVKYYKLGVKWATARGLAAELEGGTGMEQYFLAGRADRNDALYLQTSFITLRTPVKITDRLELAPSAGWNFGGLYYTGSRYDDYRDKMRVKAGPSCGLSARYSF
jgi:hypothetical protein